MKLDINKIIVDEELYPRNQVDWMTVYRYQEALAAGAAFPPIVVGRKRGQFILLDGRHRLMAHKKNEAETLQVIVSGVKPEEFFLESVRLNSAHGRNLTTQERIGAAARLITQGFSEPAISKALFMPVETLKRLMVTRLVRRPGDGVAFVRKAPTMIGAQARTPQEQRTLAVRNAGDAFRQVIQILEHTWYDPNDVETQQLLLRLRELIAQVAVSATAASA
jgi:hypothetical protein